MMLARGCGWLDDGTYCNDSQQPKNCSRGDGGDDDETLRVYTRKAIISPKFAVADDEIGHTMTPRDSEGEYEISVRKLLPLKFELSVDRAISSHRRTC